MSKQNRSPARIGIAERIDAKGRTQYRGTAYDKRAKRHLRGPWTDSLAAARAWRVDALARLQAGTLSADRGPTVADAVTEFVRGIESGAIRTRSGSAYKPSAIDGYRRDLRARALPAFGASYLREVTLPDVQRWADGLAREGLAPSTVRNVVTSLRALYGWALPRGLATVNPTRGLRLPTGETARDRIVSASEAATLIAALRPKDQAAFGLAVYAGLRIGELLALTWDDVDLAEHTLNVRRAWYAPERRFVAPKSKAGTRTVPVTRALSVLLSNHRVLSNQAADGLLFPGADRSMPVHPVTLRDRCAVAWKRANVAPLGFHEARHTFASLMISAGVNAKALSTFMGHAAIAITYDRYGHLMPGAEHEARDLLDLYLADADA